MNVQPSAIDANQSRKPSGGVTSLHTLLLWVIGFGVLLVLIMLNMAFGISGVGFGIIAFAIAFAFIIHRYRFSLRTFFVAVTVVSIWLGLKLNREVRVVRTIANITNNGGQLKLCDRRPNFPWSLWSERYDLNYWGLKQALPREHFDNFEVFAPSSFRDLNLTNTGVTDEDLRFLGQVTNLEYLSLSNATYGSGKTIPDRPLNAISDAGLQYLHPLARLKRIMLGGTDITDEGLRVFADMQHMRCIYLEGTGITGAGFAYLTRMKTLYILQLNGCNLTPAGYQALLKLSSLVHLNFSSSNISDADLLLLASLPQPNNLILNNTHVSNDAISQFKEARPDCLIQR